MCSRTICLVVFLFVLLIAVQPAQAGCSNASLNGPYGYFHGRPSGAAGQKVLVGQIIADGKGNVVGSWTMSLNGAISDGNFTGTYSIAKNCTGTLTLSNEDQSPADYTIVLDDSHHGFQMLQTDAGTAQPGFGVAQGRRSSLAPSARRSSSIALESRVCRSHLLLCLRRARLRAGFGLARSRRSKLRASILSLSRG